jgi:hypothetical protein
MARLRYLRIESDLNDTLPVTEVDEYEATMVPASVHPAGKGYLLANIFLPQLTAVVAFKQELLFS